MRTFKWVVIGLLLIIIGFGVYGYAPDTDPAEMRTKYASTTSQFLTLQPGLTVHVRDEGKRDGEPLVLIHGSNASLHTWEPWVARLGGQYRIISLDLPGHGLTGRHPGGVYDYPVFVETVAGVMDRLGIKRAAIAGNSMGGGTAWMFALAHPDRTAALILVDAAGAPEWQARKAPIGFRLARMPGARSLMKWIAPRSMFESSLKTTLYDPAHVTPTMIDRYWELNRYPGNREATMRRFALAHNNHPASREQLAAIKAPTLILWGQEDNLIPVASARWFQQAMPGSRLIIYPHVGHVPMEEVADQSAKDVAAFLTETHVN
jgi:pimeloyl-ACP methyl ester carboxylesterase